MTADELKFAFSAYGGMTEFYAAAHKRYAISQSMRDGYIPTRTERLSALRMAIESLGRDYLVALDRGQFGAAIALREMNQALLETMRELLDAAKAEQAREADA